MTKETVVQFYGDPINPLGEINILTGERGEVIDLFERNGFEIISIKAAALRNYCLNEPTPNPNPFGIIIHESCFRASDKETNESFIRKIIEEYTTESTQVIYIISNNSSEIRIEPFVYSILSYTFKGPKITIMSLIAEPCYTGENVADRYWIRTVQAFSTIRANRTPKKDNGIKHTQIVKCKCGNYFILDSNGQSCPRCKTIYSTIRPKHQQQ